MSLPSFRWEGVFFVWNGLFYEARSARWRAKIWPVEDNLYDVILIRPGGNRGGKGYADPMVGLDAAKAEWIKYNREEVW